MGPTGSGKSAWAIRLAHRLRHVMPCEIISADSVMVYKGLDIGSAKPSVEERAGIPHHLIDICSPNESYSAADFRTDALKLIQSLHARGMTPLIVGGSMLYFYILRYGIAPIPAIDRSVRAELYEQAQVCGWPAMHRRLQDVDPDTAKSIHPHHSARIARALEVYRVSGTPISILRKHRLPGLEQLGIKTRYSTLLPGPWPMDGAQRSSNSHWRDFEARLRLRIADMLRSGLVAECVASFGSHVRDALDGNLAKNSFLPATRAVGYRQILDYAVDSKRALPTLVGDLAAERTLLESIMSATRRTVRHQLNWLARFPDIRRITLTRCKTCVRN